MVLLQYYHTIVNPPGRRRSVFRWPHWARRAAASASVPPPPASPGPRPGGTAPATGASCEDHRVTWKNLEKHT